MLMNCKEILALYYDSVSHYHYYEHHFYNLGYMFTVVLTFMEMKNKIVPLSPIIHLIFSSPNYQLFLNLNFVQNLTLFDATYFFALFLYICFSLSDLFNIIPSSPTPLQ